MTTLQTPESIHASIHQDAINRVAGFFNATTKDILNELFQNARRSGATRVDITTQDNQVTVTDDGAGISDPATILAFGQTGWEDKTAQSEHPAGMGLYALARSQQVTIRSKTPNGTAWQVDLTPDHFVGKLDAPVNRLNNDTNPPGTTVTFTGDNDPEPSILNAAKYYPLPVQLNGKTAEQADFLRNAIYTEVWEGIKIGVYPFTRAQRWYTTGRMNFYGIIVDHPDLPKIWGIQNHWHTQVDVLDCPHLELTLPARREVIETQFMNELRMACRKAIYQALTLLPEPPDIPKKAQQEAESMGIKLPDAAPVLQPWEPETADQDSWNHRPRTWEKVSEDTVVIDLEALPADQQALARAAQLSGNAPRIMEANKDLEGYDWYDHLPKAKSMTITVTTDGEDRNLEELRENNERLENPRPDRIEFTLETVDGDDKQATIVLPSDLAFENEEEDYMDDNKPLVTKDSNISVQDLAEIMQDSYFHPSDDSDSDSYDTQKENHHDACEKTALLHLSSTDDAVKTALANVIKRHAIWEVPHGAIATIRIQHGAPIEITLEKAGEEGR